MFSENQSVFLVASIQQYVSKLNNPGYDTTDLDAFKPRAITKPKPINRFNPTAPAQIPKPKMQVEDNQSYYQLWSDNSNNFSSNKRNNSECSAFSTSPTSSIESYTSNEANEPFIPKNQRKLELPSKKAMNQLADLSCLNSAPSKANACCSFCKNNGEPKSIYLSHSIKDSNGKITCPLLKIYKCPICGESGANAHTITYCKKYKLARRNNILNSFKN